MLHAFPSAAPSSYEPTEALLLPSPRELPGLWAVNCLPWAPGRCKAILTTCFPVGGLKMELATPQVCTPEEYPCVLFLRALRVHLCVCRHVPVQAQFGTQAQRPFVGRIRRLFSTASTCQSFPRSSFHSRDSDLPGCWE